MVINEEKKILKDMKSYIVDRTKKLSQVELEDYRRKKLKEVRKGTGSGRKVGFRPKFASKAVKDTINEMRDEAQKDLMKRMKEFQQDLKKSVARELKDKGTQEPKIKKGDRPVGRPTRKKYGNPLLDR